MLGGGNRHGRRRGRQTFIGDLVVAPRRGRILVSDFSWRLAGYQGPLGNVASCRRGRDAGEASSGTRQDAAKTPRDAAETRRRRGTRPGREKKDARDHPRTEAHDHERRPRDRTQTRGTRETRERRSPDAGRRPRRRPDTARRGRDAPDAAKTRLPRRAGDAGGPDGDCPGTWRKTPRPRVA
jgi:hypothetical protein